MNEDLFGSIKQTITETAGAVGKKTEEFVETQKMRNKVRTLQREIRKKYADVGEIVYKRYVDGDTMDEELTGHCEVVMGLQKELAECKESMAAKQGKNVCPACGISNPKDAVFCMYCGTELPGEEEEKEEEWFTQGPVEETEDQEEIVTEEEIKAMLKMGAESGTVEDSEREMINSVFSFGDKSARELMVPRREVFAVDIEDPDEEILDAVLESRHSRIPVYEETVDNIIGILHAKDVMIEMRKKTTGEIEIRGLLRDVFFVPDTKDADDLFRELQASRRHMAVLVDEYGGFSGIITVEDLVEAIMGDIHEEDEVEEPEIQQLSDEEYLVDGGILLEDLNEELPLSLFSENYDTLSGYMIENLGYIPKENEQASVLAGEWQLRVEQVKDNRIARVHVSRCMGHVSEK